MIPTFHAKWGVSSNEIIVTGYSNLLRKDIIGTKAVNVALAINRENYDWKLDGNKVVFTGKPYTVTYYDTDGTTVINTEQVPYGEVPSYVCTKAPYEANAYVFKGWDPAPVAVTGEASYVSRGFDTVERKCTVTWMNDDGVTVRKTEQVKYNNTPVYDGAIPTKAADAQYTYSFKGWDRAITAATDDVIYTATYNKTVNKYTVTWVNYDGTVLYKAEYEYGQMPVYSGTEPTRASDNDRSYTFTGWDKDAGAVTGDTTYRAVYKENREGGTSLTDSIKAFTNKLLDTIRSLFDRVRSIFSFLPC